jgi:glycosyltransferase involved in cell wall biosynthesis
VIDLGEGYPNAGLGAGSPLRFARRISILQRCLRKLCHLIRERRVDVIDAHSGAGYFTGSLAGALTGKPVVVTTYNVRETWRPLWLWAVVHQLTLAMAAAVITDSEAVRDELQRWMIRRHPRILVIPNGVAPLSSDKTNAQMREILGLPEDPDVRIVGQVSTLVPTKGHLTLIEAARTVLDEAPKTAFLIIGYPRSDSGDYPERLARRAAELGIADKVRIVGYPGQIGDIWQVIDIQAHPTLLDSLPNAIIEAMSMARPSIVTPIRGIPTMVDDGRTGYIVPTNDPPALAAALLRLLHDPQKARAFGEAAHARYLERYCPEITTRSLEEVFMSIAWRHQ